MSTQPEDTLLGMQEETAVLCNVPLFTSLGMIKGIKGMSVHIHINCNTIIYSSATIGAVGVQSLRKSTCLVFKKFFFLIFWIIPLNIITTYKVYTVYILLHVVYNLYCIESSFFPCVIKYLIDFVNMFLCVFIEQTQIF